jgi:serine O-acetyltransferase
MKVLKHTYKADVCFLYKVEKASWLLLIKAAINPSIVAAQLFRLSAESAGIPAVVARWLTIALFSSEVASGAQIRGPISIPHPLGIVIGRGARIGPFFTVYQNVTIGSSSTGGYPVIGAHVTVYSGSVVFGSVEVGDGSVIGANEVVSRGRTSRSG